MQPIDIQQHCIRRCPCKFVTCATHVCRCQRCSPQVKTDMALQRLQRLPHVRHFPSTPRGARCSDGLALRSHPEILRHYPAILDTLVGKGADPFIQARVSEPDQRFFSRVPLTHSCCVPTCDRQRPPQPAPRAVLVPARLPARCVVPCTAAAVTLRSSWSSAQQQHSSSRACTELGAAASKEMQLASRGSGDFIQAACVSGTAEISD